MHAVVGSGSTPEAGGHAGRAWEAKELRLKSFEDLQRLWYVCYKEENVLRSEQARRKAEGKRLVHWDRMRSVRG